MSEFFKRLKLHWPLQRVQFHLFEKLRSEKPYDYLSLLQPYDYLSPIQT